MRKLLLATVCSLLFFTLAQAQKPTLKAINQDSTLLFSGLGSANFSQVSLSNWNGGGNSALSVSALADFTLKKIGPKYTLKNRLTMAYGLQKIEDQDFRKTDDQIEFSSEHKTKAFDKWDYISRLTFRSQLDKGFIYPTEDSEVLISDFLAPGYFLLSFGLNRDFSESFRVSVSPLAGKLTVVTNDSLSAIGAFGVDPGKTLRTEFGGKLTVDVDVEIMKNITYTSTLQLFSNYLEKPQNIDVNWDNLIAFSVNEVFSTTLTVNLIYDDDIDITGPLNDAEVPEFIGPRVQFKQVFSLGIQYKF